jgi:glycerol-3-phosphate dehydrogenase
MEAFLRDVNGAFPNLDLERQDILHVYAGHLPAKRRGSSALAKEEMWIDHSNQGGPEGLFSVQGTKFTAARSSAEKGIAHIYPDRTVSRKRRDTFQKLCAERRRERGIFDYNWRPDTARSNWREHLSRIVEEESVLHLDDLILRRTSIGDNPKRALEVASALCDLFDWTEKRRRQEIKRVDEQFPRIHTSSFPVDERT